jgi:hypothetical protein
MHKATLLQFIFNIITCLKIALSLLYFDIFNYKLFKINYLMRL